jgi:hypothetical protein
MTDAVINNLLAQNHSANKKGIESPLNNADDNYFSNVLKPSTPAALINDVNALDEKIARLEQTSEKTQKRLWSKVYNIFSKKDDKLQQELSELKAAKSSALADDGIIDAKELKQIEKEYKEADESLKDYMKSKKKAADITSTVAAIGVGVAITAATAGTAAPAAAAGIAATAATTSTAATAGSIAIAAAGSAVTKVATKEGMLGDEYKAIGKEGLKDGLISAAYTAVGGVTSIAGGTLATSASNGVGKVVSGNLAKNATKVLVKSATSTAGDLGVTIAADKNLRQEIAKGDLTNVAIIAGSSLVFKGTLDAVKGAEQAKGVIKAVSDLSKKTHGKIILADTSYVAKNNLSTALKKQVEQVKM